MLGAIAGAYRHVAGVHAGDPAKPVVDLDHVPRTDRLVRDERESGDEIRHQSLQAEADAQSDGAAEHGQGGQIETHDLQGDQQRQNRQQYVEDLDDQGPERGAQLLNLFQPGLDEPPHGAGSEEQHHEPQQRAADVQQRHPGRPAQVVPAKRYGECVELPGDVVQHPERIQGRDGPCHVKRHPRPEAGVDQQRDQADDDPGGQQTHHRADDDGGLADAAQRHQQRGQGDVQRNRRGHHRQRVAEALQAGELPRQSFQQQRFEAPAENGGRDQRACDQAQLNDHLGSEHMDLQPLQDRGRGFGQRAGDGIAGHDVQHAWLFTTAHRAGLCLRHVISWCDQVLARSGSAGANPGSRGGRRTGHPGGQPAMQRTERRLRGSHWHGCMLQMRGTTRKLTRRRWKVCGRSARRTPDLSTNTADFRAQDCRC